MEVTVIPARADNYMYVLSTDVGRALVVDPCDAKAVLRVLQEHGWTLELIFATHHHNDHVAGIERLKQETQCRVMGPDQHSIPAVDEAVGDGEVIIWGGDTIRVISTPGHTWSSACYYVEHEGIVFTGDTLFVGGCGRLFEGTAEMMWQSLQKLTALPDLTRVYCGHEYTVDNLEFALSIDPNHEVTVALLDQVRQGLNAGRVSVPSTIQQEKRTNIFLRAEESAIRAALRMEDETEDLIFGELRSRKNRF